jgi:transposase
MSLLDAASARNARLLRANREQEVFQPTHFDELIGEDDRARLVWAYVERLDLREFVDEVEAVEGVAGRPAVDPALLLSVWMLATIEGIGSARRIVELCEKHRSYIWLCGNVTLEYRTLWNFRTKYAERLEKLMSNAIGALTHAGVILLDIVAHDGLTVRARAGNSSFRRARTLADHLKQARIQVARLEKELDDDSAACNSRQAKARMRGAVQRERRVQKAIEMLNRLNVHEPGTQEPAEKSDGHEDGSGSDAGASPDTGQFDDATQPN